MSETKWTPGPWEWRDGNELRTLHDRGSYTYGSLVLEVRDNDDDEPMIADGVADLIAAAPDLYDALDRITALVERIGDNRKDADILLECNAALAKARGESA